MQQVDFAVEMRGISKSFAKLKALDGVDLQVRKGTIHALLGENGAGKSTLMKILYGLYSADAGEIELNGRPCQIKNPRQAIDLGIGMVHQHFMLVQNFTIAENIILGSEICDRWGRLKMDEACERIRELGEKYGLEVDPRAVISDVSVATQQRVEILKALYRGVDILILDEPTAVLTPQEIQSLIKTLRSLVADGKTIIIITHKLREIQEVADECTVIRRGKRIDSVKVEGISQAELAAMMVGREVHLTTEKKQAEPGEQVLEIRNLNVRDKSGVLRVKDLSLHVRRGEILAIAGVDGNGQAELVQALTGLCAAESGEILLLGQAVSGATPAELHQAGMRAIHEDRQKYGLVLDFSVMENLMLETYDQEPRCQGHLLHWGVVREEAETAIERYDIRPAACATLAARGLSGGNQQKVIIAREVEQNPDLLIACQPTRGLDVGAIEYVRKALVEQRDKGKAVLLISLELDEVLDLADRINVIYNGEIVKELCPEATDEAEIGLWMAGGQS